MGNPAIVLLHVISNFSIGGSQNLLVNHLRSLQGAYPEIKSHVCALGRRVDADAAYLARLPVEATFLEFSGNYRDPRSAAPCIVALRRLLKKLRPEIVHSYLWNADMFAGLAAVGLDMQNVFHVLDRRGDRNSLRMVERVRTRLTGRLLAARGAAFVAVSEACRQHAITQYGVSPSRIVTAHNGIALDDFAARAAPPFEARPYCLGTISRFAEEKGHADLIDVFAILAARDAPVRLKIAGDGRSLPDFQARVSRLGLSDRISFLGRVPSAADFYREIDAFVVPSIDAEGLPTTILEAMASRLPVIATDVGGATEAIDDGREGLIVPARNPAALAAAVERLVADPERSRAMGEAGRTRVEGQFTVQRMTDIIVQRVYRPLVAGGCRVNTDELRAA